MSNSCGIGLEVVYFLLKLVCRSSLFPVGLDVLEWNMRETYSEGREQHWRLWRPVVPNPRVPSSRSHGPLVPSDSQSLAAGHGQAMALPGHGQVLVWTLAHHVIWNSNNSDHWGFSDVGYFQSDPRCIHVMSRSTLELPKSLKNLKLKSYWTNCGHYILGSSNKTRIA